MVVSERLRETPPDGAYEFFCGRAATGVVKTREGIPARERLRIRRLTEHAIYLACQRRACETALRCSRAAPGCRRPEHAWSGLSTWGALLCAREGRGEHGFRALTRPSTKSATRARGCPTQAR